MKETIFALIFKMTCFNYNSAVFWLEEDKSTFSLSNCVRSQLGGTHRDLPTV